MKIGWFIVFLCLFATAVCILNILGDRTVRSGDSLYNYILAENLYYGKGYGIACVQHYPDKYSGGTWVIDSFRAPLGPLLYFPLKCLFPKNFFMACTIFNILVVTWVFPWLAYGIGREVFGQGNVALFCAGFTALHPILLEGSLSCSHDILVTALLLAGFLAFLKGFQVPKMWIGCGVFLGLAYLGKETALFWLAAFILSAFVIWLIQRIEFPRRWLTFSLIGILFFLGISSIWPVRNAMIPKDARVDKNSGGAVSGFQNRLLRQSHRIPLWWRPSSRGFSDRFLLRSPETLAREFLGNFILSSVHLFSGLFIPGKSDECFEAEFSTPYLGIPFEKLLVIEELVSPYKLSGQDSHPSNGGGGNLGKAFSIALQNMTFTGALDFLAGRALFTATIGLLAILGFIRFWKRKEIGNVLVIFFLTVIMYSFVTHSILRYFFFHLVILSVIAAGYFQQMERRHLKFLCLAVLIMAFAVANVFLYRDWHFPPRGSVDDLKLELRVDRKETARWVQTYPGREGMVIMCYAPIWLYAYSGVPAVAAPYSPVSDRQLEMLVDVINVYHVTHVIVPQKISLDSHLFDPMVQSVKERNGWLTSIYSTPLSEIYAIHHEKAPKVQISGKKFSWEDLQ